MIYHLIYFLISFRHRRIWKLGLPISQTRSLICIKSTWEKLLPNHLLRRIKVLRVLTILLAFLIFLVHTWHTWIEKLILKWYLIIWHFKITIVWIMRLLFLALLIINNTLLLASSFIFRFLVRILWVYFQRLFHIKILLSFNIFILFSRRLRWGLFV